MYSTEMYNMDLTFLLHIYGEAAPDVSRLRKVSISAFNGVHWLSGIKRCRWDSDLQYPELFTEIVRIILDGEEYTIAVSGHEDRSHIRFIAGGIRFPDRVEEFPPVQVFGTTALSSDRRKLFGFDARTGDIVLVLGEDRMPGNVVTAEFFPENLSTNIMRPGKNGNLDYPGRWEIYQGQE